VRKNVAEPPLSRHDVGVMLTVIDKGGLGYAATSDLSESGLREAMRRAQLWAKREKTVIDFSKVAMPQERGSYQSVLEKPWNSLSIAGESAQCYLNDKIVDWQTSLWFLQTEQLYLTHEGGEIRQSHQYLIPEIRVIANQGVNTQYRTFSESTYGRHHLWTTGWIGDFGSYRLCRQRATIGRRSIAIVSST